MLRKLSPFIISQLLAMSVFGGAYRGEPRLVAPKPPPEADEHLPELSGLFEFSPTSVCGCD